MTPRRPSSWFLTLLGGDRAVFPRQSSAVERLLRALACADADAVRQTLAHGVVLLVDSGGQTWAAAAPVRGLEAVTVDLLNILGRSAGVTSLPASVNGLPGAVFRRGDRVVAVAAVRLLRRRIADVWVVMNPDKLHHWNHDGPPVTQ
jgi:RNA polymerase sigma-70 factor (ECF subfamily)